MSQLKYCQGPKCHIYDTKDRKRGPKDNAWKVRRNWSFNNQADTFEVYNYLTEERRPITEEEYNNDNTITDDGRLAI